jgi:hypothetical protein
MQSFNGHLSHLPTLPPLLLGVLQNTFAIAINSFFLLISAKQTTTHHPPLQQKQRQTQTKPTTQRAGDPFFQRTLPLPKRVKEPGKQQDLQQSENSLMKKERVCLQYHASQIDRQHKNAQK